MRVLVPELIRLFDVSYFHDQQSTCWREHVEKNIFQNVEVYSNLSSDILQDVRNRAWKQHNKKQLDRTSKIEQYI